MKSVPFEDEVFQTVFETLSFFEIMILIVHSGGDLVLSTITDSLDRPGNIFHPKTIELTSLLSVRMPVSDPARCAAGLHGIDRHLLYIRISKLHFQPPLKCERQSTNSRPIAPYFQAATVASPG